MVRVWDSTVEDECGEDGPVDGAEASEDGQIAGEFDVGEGGGVLAQKDGGGAYFSVPAEVCLCSVLSPPVAHKVADLCEFWVCGAVADAEGLADGREVDPADWRGVELHEALIDWGVDQGE